MNPPKTEHELRQIILEDEDRYARMVEKLEARMMGPNGPVTDHETRMRALENWRAWMTGVGFCVNAITLVAIGVCTWMVTSGMAEIVQRLPPVGGKR